MGTVGSDTHAARNQLVDTQIVAAANKVAGFGKRMRIMYPSPRTFRNLFRRGSGKDPRNRVKPWKTSQSAYGTNTVRRSVTPSPRASSTATCPRRPASDNTREPAPVPCVDACVRPRRSVRRSV